MLWLVQITDYSKELEGKRLHDVGLYDHEVKKKKKKKKKMSDEEVKGAVIVGAGPSGLAAAACLKAKGIPSLILEKANCLASMWQLRTYDRLRLHLPKQFCELPLMPFPSNFPSYPTKQQFVAYLEDYADWFGLKPVFDRTVVSAEYDGEGGRWRVKTSEGEEYRCRWLVAATGENAEEMVPEIEGMEEFGGSIVHTSNYKSGNVLCGKDVLVVGCGNSGMEVCLDLCDHNARPSLVVRNTGAGFLLLPVFPSQGQVHILPQQMFGKSTFGLAMSLLRWLPIRIVDQFLLIMSRLMLGDTSRFGLHRPKLGPLQRKNLYGKTPVLDVGTLSLIKSAKIKVRPGIRRLRHHAVEFVDGTVQNFDAIILATGYKSNVLSWLKGTEMFSEKNGLPKKPFPNGWKGENGLYAVGFTKRGLLGASIDAKRIAQDVHHIYLQTSSS